MGALLQPALTSARVSALHAAAETVPPGSPVVVIGDSRDEFGIRFNPSGLTLETGQRSVVDWAVALSGARLKHLVWQDGQKFHGANLGVAGQEPFEMLARLGPVLAWASGVIASGAGVVLVIGGGTNGAATKAAWEPIAAYDAMVRQALSAGVKVVLRTPPPRLLVSDAATGYVLGDARFERTYLLRDWMLAQRGRPGVRVLDTFDILRRKVGAGEFGEAQGGLYVDDIHNGPRGAYLEGRALAGIFAQLCPSGDAAIGDPASGNFWPNGTLAGSSTVSGTGYSGNLATGLSISRVAGSVATCTLAKTASGSQLMTVATGAGTAGVATFRLAHAPTNALDGLLALGAQKWVQLAAKVRVSRWNGFAQVVPWLYASDNSVNVRGLVDTQIAANGGVDDGYEAVIATPPLKRGALSQVRGRVEVSVFEGNHPKTGAVPAGTGTVELVWLAVKECDNPETLFPLARP